MAHGERIAMDGARRQAQLCSNAKYRKFLLRQARHEKFHALVFSGAAEVVAAVTGECENAPPPPVMSLWQQQIITATENEQLAESLLIQQIYLEGLGQVVLQRVDDNLTVVGNPLRRLRRLILRQEEQHHEFGLDLLSHEIKRDPALVPRLEKMGSVLLGQAEELMNDLAGTFAATDTTHGNYMVELCQHLPATVPGTPGY